MLTRNLTILIPTMNRPDFLSRAFEYYHRVSFGGTIVVGDSSVGDTKAQVKKIVSNYSGKLNINFGHYPNPPFIHDGVVLKKMIDSVNTEYCVFAGDDDCLVPSGLEKCVEFLENCGDEYSAVHGYRMGVCVKDSCAFGKILKTQHNAMTVIENDSPVERWGAWMRYPVSVQYGVHRTETWRNMYENMERVPIRLFGPEVLPCSISVLNGKVKGLDVLSTFFQINENPIDSNTMYNYIMNPKWSESVNNLKGIIVNEIINKSGASEKIAVQQFDKEFWNYIMRFMGWEYSAKYGEYSKVSKIKTFIKGIPFLGSIIDGLRGNHYAQKSSCKFDLNSILKPSSPFHEDFMILHNIITSGI